MQLIFNALQALLAAVASLFVSLWGVLRAAIERYWWLFVVALGGIIFPLFTFAQDLYYWFGSMLGSWMFDHIGFNAATSGVMTSLALANYVLPIAETVSMTIGYVVVLGVITLYRFVKSYVPGVFSGGT